MLNLLHDAMKISIGYVEDLFAKLWDVIQGKKTTSKVIASPPTLCSTLEKPDKAKAVQEHKTRFSKH